MWLAFVLHGARGMQTFFLYIVGAIFGPRWAPNTSKGGMRNDHCMRVSMCFSLGLASICSYMGHVVCKPAFCKLWGSSLGHDGPRIRQKDAVREATGWESACAFYWVWLAFATTWGMWYANPLFTYCGAHLWARMDPEYAKMRPMDGTQHVVLLGCG